jgi:hypothetical protein
MSHSIKEEKLEPPVHGGSIPAHLQTDVRSSDSFLDYLNDEIGK